jgi:4-amino-4-deoxy-L-arabinose transferase-like glycosyltransferase
MRPGRRPRRHYGLALVLIASSLLKLHNLGHGGLKYTDESFHALVAKNLLRHPLQPTLIDHPYLPYDHRSWIENRVWLHKPILPLWQIAGSFALLGVSTFALRLPSVLLSAGAAWLTYLIGRALFDRRTGLVAAAIQAANPAITLLVHGYLFSDHSDVALLFWVELGAYFVIRTMQTGAGGYALLAGVSQGLAYLSKSYLAALIAGLAATSWLLPRVGLGRAEEGRIRLRHLLVLMAATLATAAPWTVYCAVRYPREFAHEHAYVFAHLRSGVENWGAPWDRVVFDYLSMLHHVFYVPALVAGIALLGTAFARRRTSLWFLYAWIVGVVTPHLLAATKTPSATLIAMPASFLLVGHLASEALERGGWPLRAWAGVTAVSLLHPVDIRSWGRGYPSPPVFGGVMWQSSWILWHLVIAFGIALALGVLDRAMGRRDPLGSLARAVGSPRTLRIVATAGLVVLAMQSAQASWRVTLRNWPCRVLGLASFARRHLPERAVLLFAIKDRGEHQEAMFLSDRTSYQLRGRSIDDTARRVLRAGGIPYIISAGPSPWPAIFRDGRAGLTVSEWRGPSPALVEEAQSPHLKTLR